MATNDVKNLMSSIQTQTEFVTSPILWQCLYVIRTVPEFQNLSFRVTRTRNDVEMVVVYREGVSGIFGAPVDPITLTFDPNGKCLVHVLFKPVQRVSIVSADSGQIEIASLLAVLRMLAGKGYLFCPGLPERFLAGKACGKFVTLHCIPFKRYQAVQCPVYYQVQQQQPTGKSSLCALCPRCMQAAKYIQTLPVFAPNNAASAAAQTSYFPTAGQFRTDQKNIKAVDSSNMGHVIIAGENGSKISSLAPPTSISKFLTLANWHMKTTASGSTSPEIMKLNGTGLTGLDMNGNSHTAFTCKGEIIDSAEQSNNAQSSVSEKLLAIKKRLQAKKGIALHPSGKQSRKLKSNMCRQCKKQFSTPASLLNHLQRHEGLTGSWQKRFREKKTLKRQNSSFVPLRVMCHGLKIHKRRKLRQLSDISVRLFLKYLDDIVPSQNGAKSAKKQGKLSESQTAEKQKTSSETAGNETADRKSLKRSSNSLSPMQTLLEAAALAGNSPEDLSSSPTRYTFYPITQGKPEANKSSSISADTTPSADPEPAKKVRKSSRLASKRAKGRNKKGSEEDNSSESIEAESSETSNDSSMLTNLNLLSTVVLEREMRSTPVNPATSTSTSKSKPVTVLSPHLKLSTAVTSTALPTSASNDSHLAPPTSKSISISNRLLNNTFGGNVLVQRAQDKQPRSVDSQNPPTFPPPLVFAGTVPGLSETYSFHPKSPQQQQGQSQTVSTVTSSLLRNIVTLGSSTASEVAAVPEESKMNNLSANDCGAIDLSKPKSTLAKTSIPSSLEKIVDMNSLGGLSCNLAQIVAGNDSTTDMMQCLMMMSKTANKPPAPEEAPLQSSIISDKQADSILQARLFASARNYRLDKPTKNAPQVQALIASTSRLPQSGKLVPKLTGLACNQTDEIQCGYKWSGSGGLVKERTQMVRELVPPDVMANFLSKVRLPTTTSQQIMPVLPKVPSPLSQISNSQPILSTSRVCPPPPKSNDLSLPPQLALNLTTSKLNEAPSPRRGGPGRPRKSVPSVVISSSSPLPAWSPTFPGASSRSILRSSLLNPSGGNQVISSHVPVTAEGSAPASNSPQNMQHKAINYSQTSSPLSQPASPINCTMSSPSLAAMLRQPATAIPEVSHSDIRVGSVRKSSHVSLQQSSYARNKAVLSLPGGVEIKPEPMESFFPEDGRIIMSLPIKTERPDPDIERSETEASRDGDCSPADLIMDIRPDSRSSKDGESKSGSSTLSRAANLETTNSTLKCEH